MSGKRLTPEREAAIWAMDFKANRDNWPFHLEELREELEALRAENQRLRIQLQNATCGYLGR